ncbi:MAG: hypothetical protein K8T91_12145 [Planctomycetes bacterium]|nr:hypothetical protein [Planctomycetota bacterium]
MVGSDIVRRCARLVRVLGLSCALGVAVHAAPCGAQVPDELLGARTVAEVRLLGNQTVSEKDIRAQINTRAGRPFDPALAQKDVRTLVGTTKFFDVRVKTQPGPSPGTVIVVFEVVEFPKLGFVHFVGNETIKTKILQKESGLKEGDSFSLSSIDEARQKLETFYRNHGYNQVRVEVKKGLDAKDGGVGFVINEGPAQKIWSVSFTGNEIVSGARLQTQIESKPGILKYIKGYVDTRKIDEDVVRLTAYYRSLGYFKARIGRELKYDDSGKWLYLSFVIDEGPRFKVRSVSFSGNTLFSEEQLRPLVELNQGDNFDQGKMNKSVTALTDAYGGVGYVMAQVQASPRTLESEPELDLVYEVKEGARYRIGKITVSITGDNPHTRKEVALNRLSFRPGEIADIRKIRDSERRLRAAAVFANDPARGVKPQIVFHKQGDGQEERTAAPPPRSIRGQSPDPMASEIGESDRYTVHMAPPGAPPRMDYWLYAEPQSPGLRPGVIPGTAQTPATEPAPRQFETTPGQFETAPGQFEQSPGQIPGQWGQP